MGLLGLTVAAGIAFAIVSQVTSAIGSQGGGVWVVLAIIGTLVLYLAQTLFSGVFAVIAARALSVGPSQPTLAV